MTSYSRNNDSKPSKLGKWILGAFGSIILAIATAWSIFYFGPKNTNQIEPDKEIVEVDPADTYVDENYEEEIRSLIATTISNAQKVIWVLENGTPHTVYPANTATGIKATITTTEEQTNENGKQCKTITFSEQNLDRKWKIDLQFYCKNNEKWLRIPTEKKENMLGSPDRNELEKVLSEQLNNYRPN